VYSETAPESGAAQGNTLLAVLYPSACWRRELAANIIIVDAHPSVLDFLKAAVGRAGFSPITARQPAEVVRLCEDAFVPLVIVGLELRGGSAMALEISRRHPATRFLFVSGLPFFAWPETDQAALARLAPGQFCFLPKPFTAQSLTECLNCLLGTVRRQHCPKHGLPDILVP
jgi:DNA-binding NtrC family response regulator